MRLRNIKFSVSELHLIMVLLSSTIYNFDNPYIRVAILLVWFSSVFSLFFKIEKDYFSHVVISIVISLFLLLCLAINFDTFDINLSGPNVEMLTPFLLLFHVATCILGNRILFAGASRFFVPLFLSLVCFVFIVDAAFRFYLNPSCFANYFCRAEVKEIGFFSTTNVIGQATSFLLAVTWFLKFDFKKTIQAVLFILLLLSMSRAAFAAFSVTFCLSIVFINFKPVKVLFFGLMSISLVCFLVLDPLELSSDGSGLSKVAFFYSVYGILINADLLSIVFGFGASFESIVQLMDVNDWSPHASVLKAVLYYGLCGLIFYSYVAYQVYKMDRRMMLPFLVFFIFGLSGGPIFWPTLSVGVVLLGAVNQSAEKLNNEGRRVM